jgi:TMAO reductase system sensor TorS
VPIGSSDKPIGTIVLQSDNSALQAIIYRLILVIGAILFATLFLALILSRVLNRFVTQPVLALAETMEHICEEENYGLRARKHSNDELGVLVTGINTMLDGIERRDAQLVVAKQAAEEANRAKSRFLAQMSHEIRTPMNGVLGIAGLLLKTSLDKKQRQFVRTIMHSGESLLNLINDILDFSKIEAGKLELEYLHFNVRQLVEETLALFSNRAEECNVHLAGFVHASVPAVLVGDSGRLLQILMNLLGNALKFTSDGEVKLNLFLEKNDEQGCLLRFEVQDSGIGIPRRKQGEIFNAFAQVDGSTTRKFGGTGLGLAICSQLVQLMQGRIGVESEEGEGATFWFTALFTLGSEEFFEKTEKPEDDTEDCSLDAEVLVAEDNLTNQIVARGLLEQLGCRVTMVENGREAVAQVLENPFDIVFMDCQMPIMDGYEATRRIRAGEKESGRPSVVIVALTAHAMKGDREHCLAVGMDDYLSKPFREDQLTDLLGRWLSCKNTDEPGGQGTQETSTQSISESEEEQPEFDNQVLENYRQIQRPDQPDIINRLITIYQKSSLTLLAEIDSAVQASDDKRLWHAAHSLKSSSANLGALKLARLCEELEMQGRAGRREQAAELAASVRHEYERTETWLDQKNSL